MERDVKDVKGVEDQQDYEFQVMEMSPEEAKRVEKEYEEKLHKFYQDARKYEIGYWYQQLAEFTFASKPLNLTALECFYLFCMYYEEEESKIMQSSELKGMYQQLTAKLDGFLKLNFPQGCFMKLSTRSPKDKGWDYKDNQVEKEAQKVISHLQQKAKQQKTSIQLNNRFLNIIYQYFLEQSKTKMKIKNGRDFIKLFSSSERIIIDIGDLSTLKGKIFQEFKSGKFQRAQQPFIDVWARQWKDFKWEEEIRCFFNNYQLNAITQYDQRTKFGSLQANEHLIKDRIMDYFQKLKPKLIKMQLSCGGLDLVVKEQQIQLIEINVFNENCRASLFSWKEDRKVLEQGPLEVRFMKEEYSMSRHEVTKVMAMFDKGIEEILARVWKNLGFQKQWQQTE